MYNLEEYVNYLQQSRGQIRKYLINWMYNNKVSQVYN